jgi:glycosyltransferase involved in cell wall biosynthesis
MSQPAEFPMLISVVIPVRNEEATLPSQLSALAGQTYRGAWEVIVVDNGSMDGTVDVARRWTSRLPLMRVIDSAGREGINHARNVGAAQARGDLVVFCDGDDVAAPQWLEAMAETARSGDLIGGPMDTSTLNDPGIAATRFPLPANDLPVSLGFLPYAFGGNLGVRSQVFRELGGFDEGYAGGCDEIEFCWRAQLAGYRLDFSPRAVMRYRYKRDVSVLARQAYGAGFGETRLYRDFRENGIRRPSIRRRLREWRLLLRRCADLFKSPVLRGVWVRWASYWFGRLRGSIRHRVLFV